MATREALRNQARALARRYLKQRNSAPLNAVRAWIGTDRERSKIFDEELDEAIEGRSAKEAYEDTFPPSPVDPISLPTLSTEADDRYTPLRLLAFQWMCCMELQPTRECREAWGVWVGENLQHHIEYLHWYDLWIAFWDYKKDRIFSARPTTELPDLETLGPSELEAAIEAERDCVMRERAAWLNHPSARPKKLSSTFGEICRHSLQPQVLTLFLATQTKVEVVPELMRRRVVLLAGEIGIYLGERLYWPLELEVDGIQFIATGGTFAVRRHGPHRIDFSVSSGAVHMRCASDASLPPGLRDVSQACAMGYKIQVTPEGAAVVPLPSGYPGTVLSWRDGKTFWFDSTTLEEVVAQYNRYRNELLEIVDPDLADVQITGRFPIGNVQVLLDHLSKHHSIQVKRVTRLSGIAHFICLSRTTPASAQ